jgi:hypothetical protein
MSGAAIDVVAVTLMINMKVIFIRSFLDSYSDMPSHLSFKSTDSRWLAVIFSRGTRLAICAPRIVRELARPD